MPTTANLVYQTTADTGTGNVTLTAATGGYQTFNGAFGSGATSDVFYYFIYSQTLTEWEVGSGHMSSSSVLVRDTVINSSNANAAVNFSAGIKNVVNDIPAGRGITLGAETATTSGTSFTFLIPAGTRRIIMHLIDCSLSGADNFLIQLGTGGSLTTSGYKGTVTTNGVAITASTAGLIIRAASGAAVINHKIQWDLENSSNNTWTAFGVGDTSQSNGQYNECYVPLAGSIDRITLLNNGASTFDAGKVNISYE